ncbi:TEF21 [Auxenochlorella protothecoides x Auxenochlorella symbiontica]|uniref:SAC domain-containing protein n=3 Tax=Auxenochlorella protothecoides TaxID=3075 RepID=A0A3M7KRY8_AUXPR|nr:hypothetical protein APUTEX25_001552 [Auxenochlorella protothecoides]|eukprot:RMZ52162.1 hypothetical protein APUTEX25_001552 [Auxenochlorella protothecoides]
MTGTLDFYPALRLQRLGSVAVVQPVWESGEPLPALTVDLETGSLAASEHPHVTSDFVPCFGVLGMLRLEGGPALVVITGVSAAGIVREHLVLKVTSTKVLYDTSHKWSKSDKKLLKLLAAGVDPKQYGGSLYFSHAGDITLTAQRAERVAADPQTAAARAWQRADLDVTWNAALARPLLDAGLDAYVPPVFMGFVEQLNGLDFLGGGRQVSLGVTLIARRSRHRPGTRQWRRGADQQSHVANYVETEQIVSDGEGALLSSFVQARGSLPLLWSQTPCLKYKIPLRLAPPSASAPVFAGHADRMVEVHGAVTAINLANQGGREGVLSAAYVAAADAYAASRSGFRLVPFDFHAMCGATNYARLSVLWDELAPDFERYGAFTRDGASGAVAGRQRGVFRTNCVDTLDRTNVVQGLLGRKALEATLRALGVLAPGAALAAAYPEAERRFRVAWADHGDEVSRQYAGTGAMKSAFTRTGKRDVWGLLDDGAKSLTRYYLNNFQDGAKQDAIDLVTGAFVVKTGREVQFRSQPSPALPLLAVLVAIVVAFQNAGRILAGQDQASSGALALLGAFVQRVVLLLILALGVVIFLFKNGRRFVDQPQLRKDAARPWGSDSS